MKRHLEGIRVIDLTAYLAGPYVTLNLAAMGAEIIKIENPGRGDPSRVMFQPKERKIPPGNHSILYEFSNRNKKGITLNLSSEKGRDIAYRLIRDADGFFSNF